MRKAEGRRALSPPCAVPTYRLDLLESFRSLVAMQIPAAQTVFAARWWRWNVEGGVPIER
ncbi:hypothetical protein GGQ97_001236 [Sphingomonas kaistensis]|uniref:Uncharacterized protein n=1 Tax=Sphingomonas kaistensis TaxID=298708 RepID=A0A7X5Y593_9SPHN|nr:hypothetical protein [Sphingomonas kaistensis]